LFIQATLALESRTSEKTTISSAIVYVLYRLVCTLILCSVPGTSWNRSR
jgi:hypothetical protein